MPKRYFGILEREVTNRSRFGVIVKMRFRPEEAIPAGQKTWLQIYKSYRIISANSLILLPPMIEFKVTGDYIPLIQLLKAANLVQTGGEAQNCCNRGPEVKYNGEVDYRKRLKVKKGDVVEFRDQQDRGDLTLMNTIQSIRLSYIFFLIALPNW